MEKRDLTILDTHTKRNIIFDIIKGFAIFLMLWGHCIQCCYPTGEDFFLDNTFKIIYSFHMPLLMLVSGYLFQKSAQRHNKSTLIGDKVLAMIKPIIGGNIFVYLLTTVLFSIVLQKDFSVILNGEWLNSMKDLWFLWSVLATSIVFCIVEIFADTGWKEIIIVSIGFIFVSVFPNAEMNLYMYPYFAIGYYYSRYKASINKVNWIKYTSIVLFPVMICFFRREHYIYTSGIWGGYYSIGEYLVIDMFRWAIGLVGSVFVITVVELLCKVKSIGIFMTKTVAPLGKKSLQIYVLSVIFLSSYLPTAMSIIRKIPILDSVYNVISQNAITYDLIFTLAIAVVYAIALYWLVKLLEKIRVSKLIFGR